MKRVCPTSNEEREKRHCSRESASEPMESTCSLSPRARETGGWGSYGISIKLVVNIFLYLQGSLLDIIVI